MIIFESERGDNRFAGTADDYDQVDYAGTLSEYTFVQNADGSVTVTHPVWGTDTLTDIDGFWFAGEARWYSMADVIAASTTDGTGTIIDGVITGGAGNDTLTGSSENSIFYAGAGDDIINGNGGNYNQAEYDGALSEYTFVQNADGSVTVTHPVWGTDTLTDIDGFWFAGEARWYSMEDAIAASNTGGTGTLINGVITGGIFDDILNGSSNDDAFYAGMGTDIIIGGSGVDTLSLDGDLIEWTITARADGTIVMTHPTWGENTLNSVEQLFFIRGANGYSIADAIELTANLPEFRLDADDVINGTNLADRMIGTAGDEKFYGGLGDDFYDGGLGDGFDQINYDGNRADYDITQNTDGTYTISHDVWGTDTFQNIDGLYFNGDNEFILIDDLFM